jgi:hypothetical protein
MPEFYYGVADPDSFGLSGIYILPLVLQNIWPLCGNWSWFIRKWCDLKAVYIGTNLKFGKEDYFRSFTTRNFFKYNQFALGYRLDFKIWIDWIWLNRNFLF